MFVCLLPCNTSHSVQCHSSRYSLRVALALSWLTHGSSQALLCIVQYILQHIGKSSDGVWNWPRVAFLRCQQTYHRCSLSQSGFGSSTARWPVLLYFKTLDVMSLIDWFLVWWTSWLMSDQWYHHPNAGQNLPLLPQGKLVWRLPSNWDVQDSRYAGPEAIVNTSSRLKMAPASKQQVQVHNNQVQSRSWISHREWGWAGCPGSRYQVPYSTNLCPKTITN